MKDQFKKKLTIEEFEEFTDNDIRVLKFLKNSNVRI